MSRVAVIGAGSWGTAAAGLVARHADEVVLWAHSEEVARGISRDRRNPRYLTGYELPANVGSTTDLARALEGAASVLVAVPSAHLRATLAPAAALVAPDAGVLVLTKGMELGTGLTMAEVVGQELGGAGRVCALSGPNHAEEISAGKLSASVVAGTSRELCRRFQDLLIDTSFRVYVTDDIAGVEVCGATKNVVAIAAGAAVGLGLGDNALAVIMTRGLAEMARISVARGGDPRTCMGLAGMGDLVATCTSRHSRNRSFGERLARGCTLAEYERETHMVVEGARAAASVSALAGRLGVEAPMTDIVHRVLDEGLSVRDAMGELLSRVPDEEFYGFDRRPAARTEDATC